ncbi:MAG: mannose-1-phosphate guanylyltransferase/mannose-6-phosphate isomerase [Paracoccaceae bacterium]
MADASDIHPVILCGGAGTRLWPLSRRAYPKQFSPLFTGGTLFQRTIDRIAGQGYAAPLLLTSSAFRFIVAEQLADAGLDSPRIVIEPETRNTAPAVCLAALMVAASDPEALLLVLPSDHLIRDVGAFRFAVAVGAEAARAGHIVTFGVRPTRAETGYGYLELPGPPGDRGGDRPEPFLRFIEKPGRGRAEAMLATGRYLWNSGVFLFRAHEILAAFDAHAPEITAACARALEGGREDLCFFRPGEQAYCANPAISLDYAVIERVGRGMVVPIDCGWNDLGSWRTVWQESPRDSEGTATAGPALAVDCRDTLLVSAEPGLRLVGLGLEDVIAVAMRDAVLVAAMDRAQDVRLAVEALKADSGTQADDYPRCHCPWGWYEIVTRGPRFQIRRIMVRPGARLSLQSHAKRAEHWVVVAGTARVTLGEGIAELGPDQSCHVAPGQRHRLENPGAGELHLIEVQSGDYLGEDDITRYDDV